MCQCQWLPLAVYGGRCVYGFNFVYIFALTNAQSNLKINKTPRTRAIAFRIAFVCPTTIQSSNALRSLPCACYFSKQMKVKAQILRCFFSDATAFPSFYSTHSHQTRAVQTDESLRRKKRREFGQARRSFALVPKLLPKSTKAKRQEYVCMCWPCWPFLAHKHTHTHTKAARTKVPGHGRELELAVEFEFAAQILCERKYFYLVNVIYYLCLFEHLSSAA